MSSVAQADDTEIFFSQASGSADTFPNIMFILDDSGSMRGNKMIEMKTAMKWVIENFTDINVGMMNFIARQGLGKLLYPVTSLNDAGERAAMLAAVDSLTASGGTPLVGAHYEAAMAMTGGPIELGSERYVSPMVGQCQNNHIILLSDGSANSNRNERRVRDYVGVSRCAERGGNACGTELARHLMDTDHRPGLARTQNITTYTIGFQLRSNYLRDVAAAGGGEYFEASNSGELQAVFEDIIGSVADVETTFIAPTTSVDQLNRLSLDTELYFSLFKPTESPTWLGNLKRYQLGYTAGNFNILDKNNNDAVDPATGFFKETATSYWSDEVDGDLVSLGGAASQLDGKALDGANRRRVYTYTGDINREGPATLALSSNYANELHENNLGINSGSLGLGATRTALLRWMRGYDVKDEDSDGNVNEARAHMGDPLHSTPVVVRYEGKSTVFVATNEGLLHAIDTEDGKEIYSFMPKELYKNINPFFVNDRNIKHPYGLDGDITLLHDDDDGNGIVNGSEKARLYVGMRRGGRDYFAFDVSERDKLTYLWKIEGAVGEFAQLGQTWSKPTVSRLNIDGSDVDVLIFGGGYNPNQDSENGFGRRTDSYGNTIYIVNAETGDLIWTARNGEFGDMDYSIPSNIRVMDIDANGLADRLYVGDMGGQVWRFDINQFYLRGGDPLVKGGVIADLGAPNSADSLRFFSEPDVALINQQGQRFMSISIGSGWRAHPLDGTTNDKFFMVRDNYPLQKPEGYGVPNGGAWRPIQKSDLVDVTNALDKTLDELPHGWYLKLDENGEKSLSKSLTINNQVLFTTYQPGVASSMCEPAVGSGSVYAVNVVNGAPVMALDGGGAGVTTSFEKADRKKPLGITGIPPAPTGVVAMVNGQIETGVMVGQESLEDVDFGELTRRTYWLDNHRGPATPAQLNAGGAAP